MSASCKDHGIALPCTMCEDFRKTREQIAANEARLRVKSMKELGFKPLKRSVLDELPSARFWIEGDDDR